MYKSIILVSLLSTAALASEPVQKITPQFLKLRAVQTLACPAGTQLLDRGEAMTCTRNGEGHGPYVSFWGNGRVSEKGQFVDGFRDGSFSFFDDAGRLLGTTEFKRGSLHGKRVSYDAAGKVATHETYVEGAPQK